jgi:UPF0271 protein
LKLNCDLGESYGRWSIGIDEQVMPLIDCANIACGFHAGDPVVLADTIALAKKHQVEIGAHPSYPDLQGFGRRSMQLSENELRQLMHYQIAAISGMAKAQGTDIHYVKPHGALYNDMMRNPTIRQTLMQAVADYPADLSLMLQATPHFEKHQQEAKNVSIEVIFEAFADRCYADDGSLVRRSKPNAVLGHQAMMTQVSRILSNSEILTESSNILSFPIDTLCIHGDNETAIKHLVDIKALVDAS